LFYVPSLEYLDSFIANAQSTLEPYLDRNLDKEHHRIQMICHITSLEVLLDPKYLELISRFESEEFPTEHLVDT